MRGIDYEVAKCQICKSDDYEILYIEDYAYHGDFIIVLAKAHCCNCGAEFWVKEYFDFGKSKNILSV